MLGTPPVAGAWIASLNFPRTGAVQRPTTAPAQTLAHVVWHTVCGTRYAAPGTCDVPKNQRELIVAVLAVRLVIGSPLRHGGAWSTYTAW